MAFRDNSTLVRSSNLIAVEPDNRSLVHDGAGASTFYLNRGDVGNDLFLNFGSDDSFLTPKAIYDRNGDGFITPGPNGIIDIDRTGPGFGGNDHIQVVGGMGQVLELRSLGTKAGQYAYADASTRTNLWAEFGAENVIEGGVGNDRIDAAAGAKVILHDNALGLNLGGDTISGFGSDDLLVTTSQIFDGNGDGTITFGRNRVLDTSGVGGPSAEDPRTGSGGQLKFTNTDLRSIEFLGSNEINGVSYYYYGTAASTYIPATLDGVA